MCYVVFDKYLSANEILIKYHIQNITFKIFFSNTGYFYLDFQINNKNHYEK